GVFALEFVSCNEHERGRLRRVSTTNARAVAHRFENAGLGRWPFASVDAQGRTQSFFAGQARHPGSFSHVSYGQPEPTEFRGDEHILDLPDGRRLCVHVATNQCRVLSEEPITQRPLAQWLDSQPPLLAGQVRYWLEHPPSVRVLGAPEAEA